MLKKILLSKLRALGDTVLLSATLEETKRLFPQDQIHLLVPEAWKDLYNSDPRVNKVWTFDTRLKGVSRILAFFNLARELRHLDVDISLACHANPTSSWLGFLSGAQIRAHHNHNFLEDNKFSNVEIPDKKILKPFIQRDLAVLKALEKKTNDQIETKIYLSQEEKAFADQFFSENFRGSRVLGLGLGASRSTKIWPVENFVEIAKLWNAKHHSSVLCFVSPSERPLAEQWKKALPENSFEIVSNLSLSQMKAVMSRLAFFAGNDSGPRHLAAALGVATLTIYGPQDPFECHPYNRERHPYLFLESLPCRKNTDLQGLHPWCGIAECLEEKHRCMTELKSNQAWSFLDQL